MNQTEKDFIKLVLEDERFNDNTKKLVIESIFERHRDQLDDELKEYLYRQYAGAALQLGSAFMPAGSLGKAGIQVGEQLLKKSIGRKLSQEIGAGAAVGMGSGAVFGAGRGISENKNPILTAVTDALTGLFSGGALGAIGGNIQKMLKGNSLKNYSEDQIFSANKYKTFRKEAETYYKNYLQNRIINHEDLGEIEFTRKGMDEIFSKNPNLAVLFPDLVKDLKSTSNIEISNLYKARNKTEKNLSKFYYLYNDKYQHMIAEDKMGHKKYYLTKKYNNTTDQGTPSKQEGTSSDGIINTNPAFPNDDRGHKLASNNIITNNSANVKSENANLNNNSISKIVQSFLAAGISKNVYDKNHIFTLEEIGAMTQEEFEENEDAIMEQMAKGQIRPTARDYSNFKNPYNGDDRIFSREDIDAMTTKEFEENEQAIYAQMKSIGVPYNSELAENARRNGVVYVRAYKREDGTEVKGYYRSLPRY